MARRGARQGHLHLDAHSYLAAKHCFTQAIKEDKVVVSYWLHRAVANIHLQEWRAALSDVDRALGLDARNADAHVLRAKLYWKLGMLPQGNADMTAAVALDPGHPEVVEFEEARWSIAESAYQRAASLMLVRARARTVYRACAWMCGGGSVAGADTCDARSLSSRTAPALFWSCTAR